MMKILLALFGLCIVATLAAPAFFAPFGSSVGDSVLHRNDDEFSGQISLIGGMNFFGSIRQTIFVNNNGLLTLDSSTWEYTPRPLSQQAIPTIAAFWADVDTRCESCGYLYYRSTVDATVVADLSQFVRDTQSGNAFVGTKAFIATWDSVGYFPAASDRTNTFQIALIANSEETYAIMNYGVVQWTYGSASNGQHARVGFSKGNGGVSAELPFSGQSTVVNVEEGTNAYINSVPQTGRYIFNVGGDIVISACCSTSNPPALSGTPSELHFNIAGIDEVPVFSGSVVASAECTTPNTFPVEPTYFVVMGCPVERTWRAVDSCAKSTSVTQFFTYPEVFTEELTITTPATYNFPADGQCVGTPAPSVAITGEASSNRGTFATVSFTDTAFSMVDGVCTLTRYWIARDICRKEVIGVQTITKGAIPVDVTTGALTTGILLPPMISVAEFCAPQPIDEGDQRMYCNVAGNGYYACLTGAFNSQSAAMSCPPGLTCNCGAGMPCDPVCDWPPASP